MFINIIQFIDSVNDGTIGVLEGGFLRPMEEVTKKEFYGLTWFPVAAEVGIAVVGFAR